LAALTYELKFNFVPCIIYFSTGSSLGSLEKLHNKVHWGNIFGFAKYLVWQTSHFGTNWNTNTNSTMRITPTSTYESLCIYYIIIVVNLLHVSVTCCDHLQGSVFKKYSCAVCGITSFSRNFITDNFICILYFNIYNESHI